MSAKHSTNGAIETQQVAKDLAQQIVRQKLGEGAVVLALSGDLGAGKTTFLQGFAKALGIEEVVNSPTFVIMKRFEIPKSTVYRLPSTIYRNFYHFDCYRLNEPEEILQLGFAEIISNPENIVAIEWPEKISGLLPFGTLAIQFSQINETTRELTIER